MSTSIPLDPRGGQGTAVYSGMDGRRLDLCTRIPFTVQDEARGEKRWESEIQGFVNSKFERSLSGLHGGIFGKIGA